MGIHSICSPVIIKDRTRNLDGIDLLAYEIFVNSIDIKDTASANKYAKNAFHFADAFFTELARNKEE